MFNRSRIWENILAALLGIIFLGAGIAKLTGSADLIQVFDNFGLPLWFMYFTGIVEVVCSIGLIFYRNWIGFIAVMGLAITMVIAAIFHVAFDPLASAGPAVFLALLSAVVGWQRYKHIKEAQQN